MAFAAARALGRIRRHSTLFLLCDMQEKFRPSICYFPEITAVCKRMVRHGVSGDKPALLAMHSQLHVLSVGRGIEALGDTPHCYRTGLGHTVPELPVSHGTVFAKNIFTMLTPEVRHHLRELKQTTEISSVVLFGIETQVCISQTALDFLEYGVDVHVVADGCSSRSMADRMFAFDRLKQSGAFVTTSEAVLFELLGSSTHPKFKEVQALVRGKVPDSHLLSRL